MKPTVWYIAAGYLLPAGIEAYLLHYATAARKFGYEPRIMVFRPLPEPPHRFLQALYDRGIPIESLDTAVLPWARLLMVLSWLPWRFWMWCRRKPVKGCSLLTWWVNQLSVRRLAKRTRKAQPDVIHVKGRLQHGAWKVLPPERCIYHHALMGTVDPSWLPYEVEAFRAFVEKVRYILVPGANVGRTFQRCFNVKHETTEVFTMAPDEATGEKAESRKQKTEIISHKEHKETQNGLQSAPRGLHFGILCRFTEQKGIVYILEALRILKPKFGDLSFTFAGQGPLKCEIREFAAENGLAGIRVIPVPSAAEVLRELDVFVHPGLDDAMPVSVVEALMFGLPCVVSNVGGCPDLVRDGVEGYVIPPGDAGAIAGALRRFVEMDQDEFRTMRGMARDRYETCCTPEVVMRQVAEIYGEIAGCVCSAWKI